MLTGAVEEELSGAATILCVSMVSVLQNAIFLSVRAAYNHPITVHLRGQFVYARSSWLQHF